MDSQSCYRPTAKNPAELRPHLAGLKVKNAVIDGEIVCLDEEGRSIFNELLFRRGSPVFYAFDLLYLDGRDMRQLPLIEQKEKLRTLIEKRKRLGDMSAPREDRLRNLL
jgi:bifunctional non-homologous end joining protein LigD